MTFFRYFVSFKAGLNEGDLDCSVSKEIKDGEDIARLRKEIIKKLNTTDNVVIVNFILLDTFFVDMTEVKADGGN